MTDDPLLDVAARVSDEARVDWKAIEDAADTSEQREILRALRDVARVAEAHREAQPESEAGGAGDAEPVVRRRWGSLEILGRLGQGGFSEVLRARDPELEREVALKLLRQDRLRGAVDRDKVVREGRLLARMSHPNVATVYGAAEHDGRVGIWMELVRGRSLDRVVREQGPLGAREAALIGIDVCRALAAVHAVGALHCDVKAQNVMREEGGRIVLMDFGTGRLETTPSDEALAEGTPLYMAPELLKGEAPSAQSEVYSLGVLLYFLVTGGFPVEGRDVLEVEEAHGAGRRRLLNDRRPGLPEAYVRVVDRALASEPDGRYPSIGAMENALESALGATVAAALADSRATQPVAPPATVRRRRRILGLVAALALVAGGIGVWRGRGPELGSVAREPTLTAAEPALAVLPFREIGRAGETGYLAEGITEQLVTRLGQIGGLRVLSRGAVDDARAHGDSFAVLSQRLGGVPFFLEGSVQVEGDDVSVSVRLSHLDGSVRLARGYRRSLGSVFALQAALAREIVAALRVELQPDQERALAHAPEVIPAAYRKYTEARHHWNRREGRDHLLAGRLFREAIEIDPSFARAHAGLADVFALAQPGVAAALLDPETGTAPMTGRSVFSQARQAARRHARRAIEIDPELGEAHATLAFVEYYLFWDWMLAERHFRRALTYNSGHATAHHWYADFLTAMGRFDEAKRSLSAARRLDPASKPILRDQAWPDFVRGRYAAALAHLDPLVRPGGGLADFGPALTLRARALARVGRVRESVLALEEAVARFGVESNEEMLAEAYALAGRTTDARGVLERIRRRTGDDLAWPYGMALIHVALGERDEANEWLSRAYERSDPTMVNLKTDQRLAPLHGTAAFDAVVSAMRFP